MFELQKRDENSWRWNTVGTHVAFDPAWNHWFTTAEYGEQWRIQEDGETVWSTM